MTEISEQKREIRAYSFGRMARAALAAGLAILLSGCIVVPAYGPHYYHPYRGYW